MAQKIVLVDDLDGTEAVHTLTFLSVAGDTYQIDLSAEHLAEYTRALDPYFQAARLVAKGKARKATAPVPRADRGPEAIGREKASQIRLWAKAHAIACPTHGRVPKAVVEAYDRFMEEAA